MKGDADVTELITKFMVAAKWCSGLGLAIGLFLLISFCLEHDIPFPVDVSALTGLALFLGISTFVFVACLSASVLLPSILMIDSAIVTPYWNLYYSEKQKSQLKTFFPRLSVWYFINGFPLTITALCLYFGTPSFSIFLIFLLGLLYLLLMVIWFVQRDNSESSINHEALLKERSTLFAIIFFINLLAFISFIFTLIFLEVALKVYGIKELNLAFVLETLLFMLVTFVTLTPRPHITQRFRLIHPKTGHFSPIFPTTSLGILIFVFLYFIFNHNTAAWSAKTILARFYLGGNYPASLCFKDGKIPSHLQSQETDLNSKGCTQEGKVILSIGENLYFKTNNLEKAFFVIKRSEIIEMRVSTEIRPIKIGGSSS